MTDITENQNQLDTARGPNRKKKQTKKNKLFFFPFSSIFDLVSGDENPEINYVWTCLLGNLNSRCKDKQIKKKKRNFNTLKLGVS